MEELVEVMDEDYAPDVALSVFFDAERRPAGTYTAECELGGRLRTVTLTFDPRPVAC